MIIPRIRFYSRRDELPDPFPIPEEWDGLFDSIYVSIEYSKQYDKDMLLLDSVEKGIVKKFKKDLNNKFIYVDGPAGGDTHYLEDFSKPGKYHRLTKSISTCDRMDYLVYPPELICDRREVIIPIVIQSLKNHSILGQGEYSYVEED